MPQYRPQAGPQEVGPAMGGDDDRKHAFRRSSLACAAGYFAAGYFATGYFATGYLAAGYFATGYLATGYLAAGAV